VTESYTVTSINMDSLLLEHTIYMQISCTFCILIEGRKIKIPYSSHLPMFTSAYFKVWMVDTF